MVPQARRAGTRRAIHIAATSGRARTEHKPLRFAHKNMRASTILRARFLAGRELRQSVSLQPVKKQCFTSPSLAATFSGFAPRRDRSGHDCDRNTVAHTDHFAAAAARLPRWRVGLVGTRPRPVGSAWRADPDRTDEFNRPSRPRPADGAYGSENLISSIAWLLDLSPLLSLCSLRTRFSYTSLCQYTGRHPNDRASVSTVSFVP